MYHPEQYRYKFKMFYFILGVKQTLLASLNFSWAIKKKYVDWLIWVVLGVVERPNSFSL